MCVAVVATMHIVRGRRAVEILVSLPLVLMNACDEPDVASPETPPASAPPVTEGPREHVLDAFFAISPDEATFDDAQARTLRDLGAGRVRFQLCDWPAGRAAFQAKVDAARRAGLRVYAELNYCTLPAPSDPAERQRYWHADFKDSGNAFAIAFASAAGEIAAAFAGQVDDYEIWNEPNAAPRPMSGYEPGKYPSASDADWTGACGAYPYGVDYGQGAWALCPAQLGVITTNAFMAIKEKDMRATVVAGNLLFHGEDGWVAKEYWKQVEASPAVQWHKDNKVGVPWDVVGIHPYAYDPTSGALGAQLAAFKQLVVDAGDLTPLAMTEYGWTTAPDGDPFMRTSEEKQAEYVTKTVEVARSHGIGFVMWFNYLSAPGIDFGLRAADGRWKPAARAYCDASLTPTCPAK